MNHKILTEAEKLFKEGIEFLQRGELDFAEKKFNNCLNLLPYSLPVIHNLISIYINTNQRKKLKEILKDKIKLSKEKEIMFGLAYYNYFEGNFINSIKICKQIIHFPQFKDSVEALMASNYKKKKLFLDALKIYKKKLRKNKNYLIYYDIGCLFSELGKTKTSFYYLSKSNELKNNHNSTLWNLSLCLLKMKRFESGFLLHEYRWKKKNNPLTKKFTSIPEPDNLQDIVNKKILIWDEQGLGDTLQFSRFVIDLLKYSKRLTFVVNSKLSEILKNLHKNIYVINYENLIIENFDYQIPLFSLPKYLGIKNLEDINFYKLEKSNNNSLSLIKNSNLNIGVSWSGNPKYTLDNYRSIPFKKFKDVFKTDGINFYKLSQNVRSEEFLEYNSLSNLTDFSEKSLYEIFQILPKLDLVISSDTSIIHLAGILNVKCYLLLNYNSNWRWFEDRKNTIWYPSIQIIKQDKFDSWKNVFNELVIKLEDLKNQK